MSELIIVGMLSITTVAIAGLVVVLGSLLEPRHPAALELRADREDVRES